MTSSGPHVGLAARTITSLDATSSNSTNTGSGEASANLLNDRISLIAATTLPGFAYGILTLLYCMTSYSLLRKLPCRHARSGSNSLLRFRTGWRKTVFYIIYTSILFASATLYTAGNSQNAIVAFVDNRLYPGGPYLYYVTFMAGQNVMVMTDIASLIILWMTDGLILCRFIMFYCHVPYARWVIPLPCAMYVGVVVLSTLVLQAEADLEKIFYLSENLLFSYYVLSFSLNVIATVLIAARLYWHKLQLQRMFGPKMESPYMTIAAVLIESAALYGTWSLVFLILSVLQSPGQTIVLAMTPLIQVIAPLLIILWIVRGNGWKYSKSPSELSETAPVELGSRPSYVPGVDRCPSSSRNASRSTVASDGAFKHGDNDVDVIELVPHTSRPPSVTNDDKRDEPEDGEGWKRKT